MSMVFVIGIATFFSTLLGGLFALRLQDRLHLILGFSAGAILGVAFFDLMPEALEIGGRHGAPIATLIAVGFLVYLLLDRSLFLYGHQDEQGGLRRGGFGAASLSAHSFLDGMGIGLAFKISTAMGVVVAVAVLTHDFSDGINTVNLVFKHGGERRRALHWLLVDASAPVVGVISTLFFTIEEATLGVLLALFSGFFLYIGASDLLPESYHAHPVKWTTAMTAAGMGVLYLVTKLASL